MPFIGHIEQGKIRYNKVDRLILLMMNEYEQLIVSFGRNDVIDSGASSVAL